MYFLLIYESNNLRVSVENMISEIYTTKYSTKEKEENNEENKT